jgi:predicted nucleic acid-binding protein
MNYLDSSVIVPALLAKHPKHAACKFVVDGDSMTSNHALAESFSTLTGIYKVPNVAAASLIESFARVIMLKDISTAIYLSVISQAQKRGVQGGLIYDAIHAEMARRNGVRLLITYNVTNFVHVAPDLTVVSPG